MIQGALEGVAIEMGHKLMRMAHSSIIRESEDFGCCILNARGEQLCESIYSTPLQSGPMPGYLRGILKALSVRGESFRPGDVVMHNDPYAGASHGPDVAFVVPIFHNEQLVAFSGTAAHHIDIGAMTPGSSGIVDAIDAYAEGLQFKAIKVLEGGHRNDMLWQVLRDNLRASDIVLGDMEAQIAAAETGARRFLDLASRFGIETLLSAGETILDQSERLMRGAIARLPDGVYRASNRLDGFLDSADSRHRDLVLSVAVIVEKDSIIVDLEGTSAQIDDRPLNMPLHGTVDCAVWLTLKSILLDEALHGPAPHNSGLVRPITIRAPVGSLANPVFPAPTIARACAGNHL
ncbi:MAG: hydantoinase B/oxoprolinase family protein, partial [Alphaproteobacteria bacterium]|nr:hydantoinase B/oxoprolinase family protein [Alphaproteobacteria bacterium]